MFFLDFNWDFEDVMVVVKGLRKSLTMSIFIFYVFLSHSLSWSLITY